MLDKDIAAVLAAEIDNRTLMLQVNGLLTRHKGMTDRILDQDIADSGILIYRCPWLFAFTASFQATDQQSVREKDEYGEDDKT